MKPLFCIALVVISLSITIAAQSAPKPTTAPAVIDSIRIEVQGGKSLQLKAAELAKLPRREVKAKDHDGKDTTFSGVELREILKLVGATFGADLRGPAMANFLLVEAADHYHAVFALTELDYTYTDKIIILADIQDGKPLDAKTGPWQIVVPDEKKHARWVRQVTLLSVRKASTNTVSF